MGRRRSRKRNRKQERRQHQNTWQPAGAFADEPYAPRTEEDGILAIIQRREAPKTCDRCFEFLADAEGGRGRCLHPASGVFAPWTDTKSCDYYRTRT